MFNLYPLLSHMYKNLGSLNIIQIGAFIGNTVNDPLFPFLRDVCEQRNNPANLKAVLVEPVRSYYNKLIRNYIWYLGPIQLENAAIADSMTLRKFYRLRPDIMPRDHGMPPCVLQLGSLLDNRITDLWDHHEKHPEIRRFLVENQEEEYVISITYSQLLKKYNMDRVDFLQIDAEGYDYEIIKTVSFTDDSPKIINYEHTLLKEKEAECRTFLEDRGYVLNSQGDDTLAISAKHMKSLGIRFE